MSISFSCQCGQQLSIGQSAAGKQIKCPKCGNRVRVPVDEYALAPIGSELSQSSEPSQPKMKGCPNCGTLMEESHVVCVKCGYNENIGIKKDCPRCQTKVPEDRDICWNCGHKWTPENSEQVSQTRTAYRPCSTCLSRPPRPAVGLLAITLKQKTESGGGKVTYIKEATAKVPVCRQCAAVIETAQNKAGIAGFACLAATIVIGVLGWRLSPDIDTAGAVAAITFVVGVGLMAGCMYLLGDILMMMGQAGTDHFDERVPHLEPLVNEGFYILSLAEAAGGFEIPDNPSSTGPPPPPERPATNEQNAAILEWKRAQK